VALPAEFNTVQVYGKYLSLDGTPVVGYLTFEAAPVILKAAVSKDLIVPVVLQVNLDADGSFAINLPVTDDPDINPSDWTYKVTEGFGTRRVYNLSVHLAAGPTINIYDLAPVAISTGEYYLQGETGPAGPPARITTGKPDNAIGGDGDYAIDLATGIIYHNVSGAWDNGSHLAAADIAIHAALTRTHGIQAGSALVGTTDTQTLSGKTLAAPTVTGGLTADSAHITGNETVDGTLSVAGAATLPAIQGPTTVTGNETVTGQLAVQGTTTLAGTTLTGNLDLGTHDASVNNLTAAGTVAANKVTSAATPAAGTDLVNKTYADGLGTSLGTASTIARRDASSNINFNKAFIAAAPTTASEATRKDYVDSTAAAIVRPVTNLVATTSYTFALTDENKIVYYNADTSAVAYTIPLNSAVAFPIGANIDVYAGNTGAVTISPAAGVTLRGPDGSSTVTLRALYSKVRLTKTATDTWQVVGDLVTATVTSVNNATSSATANTLVKRDGSGNTNIAALTTSGSITAGGSFIQTELGADPAVPSAGQMKLFSRTDEGLYVFGATTSRRRLKMHWGDVTAYPTTGLLTGDTCRRTDIGNTLWEYDGTYWQPQNPGAIKGKVWMTANMSATVSAYTILVMGGSWMTGGCSYDATNYGIKIPVDGFYRVGHHDYFYGSANITAMFLATRIRASVANADIASDMVTRINNDQQSYAMDVVPLKANDIIQLKCYAYNAGSVAANGESNGTNLLVEYVSPLMGATAY
jgi:hypothetical protein